MTSGDEVNRLGKRAAPRTAGQASWLLAWPIVTLVFTMIAALAAEITADLTNQAFTEAAASVAGWLLNANAEQGVEMPSGFGFLAVMATLVIGMAFSLAPEGAQGLPEKNRNLVELLTLGVTLAVSLFSAAELWVMLWRTVTFELVLLLLSAWLVSVVAGLIELKRPVEERLADARRERDRLRDGAMESGFLEGTTITRKRIVQAEVAYWLIPVAGIPFLGGVGLVYDYRGFQVDTRAWAMLMLLGLGAVIASLAWRASAPFPPHKLSDRIVSRIGKGAGLLTMLGVVLSALGARSWGFAALSTLAIGAAAALYTTPTAPRRVSFMKTIRDAATIKRLSQADAWYETVSQEFDDERQSKGSESLSEEPARAPIIRIEVFGRRSRRSSSEGAHHVPRVGAVGGER